MGLVRQLPVGFVAAPARAGLVMVWMERAKAAIRWNGNVYAYGRVVVPEAH
jgi:hypothetical protein